MHELLAYNRFIIEKCIITFLCVKINFWKKKIKQKFPSFPHRDILKFSIYFSRIFCIISNTSKYIVGFVMRNIFVTGSRTACCAVDLGGLIDSLPGFK